MSASLLEEVFRRDLRDIAGASRSSNPTVTSVLIFLAWRANDEGGNIFPTKETIAAATGLRKRAVRDAFAALMNPLPCGRPILRKVGDKQTYKGKIPIYQIDKEALESLPPAKPTNDTSDGVGGTEDIAGGHHVPPSGGTTRLPARHHAPPERLQERHEKDKRKTTQAALDALSCADWRGQSLEPYFRDFIEVFPRLSDEKKTADEFLRKVKQGHSPEDIVEGARRYAEKRQGEDQHYTKAALGWLQQERWLDED